MFRGNNNLLRSLLVLVAILVLMIGYYWVHKPIGLGLLQIWGGSALDVLTSALMVTAGGGLGGLILSRFGTHTLSRSERVALSAGLGLGLISLAVLLIGLVGLLSPLVLWLLLAAAWVIGNRFALLWLRDVSALARTVRPTSTWEWFLAAFAGLMLLTAALSAFAPPAAWDALMYHLAGPRVYLIDGAIRAHSENHYLGFSQQIEMLYTLALGLFGRDTAAAPLHWLYGLLLLTGAGGIVRRYAGSTAAWFTIALVMSSTSLWLLFGYPYVDIAIMAYAVLGLIVLDQWRESQQVGWLLLAGMCAGFLVGVKYTGALTAVAFAVYVVAYAPRQWLRNGLILAGVALLIFSPWLLKGLLLYQNPIYPFVFGGLNWDASRTENFSQTYTGLLNAGNGWQLPILPIAATIFGAENTPGFGFTLGPWLLTAPLLLLIGWRWLDERIRPFAKGLLLLMAVLLLLWIPLAALSDIGSGPRQTGAAFMALSAVAGGIGLGTLAKWPRKPFDVYFIVRGIMTFTLALIMVEAVQTTFSRQPVQYFFGLISRDAYLEHKLGLYHTAMGRFSELPDGSQVRFLWEPRTFYCPPTVICEPDTLTDAWARPIRSGLTPDEVFEGWQAQGEDYVLVWRLGFEFSAYTDEYSRFAEPNQLFPDALEKWMTPVWTDDYAYTLYTWRDQPLTESGD